MLRKHLWRRWYLLAPSLGTVFVSGCLAAAENNLDILLSPSAISNTLAAPYSAVYGLLEFLLRLGLGRY
jgi:hypothetical protein